MNTIVVDASLRIKLGELSEVTRFTDEQGRVLGHFQPVVSGARRGPSIDEAEVQRRLQQGGGRSLSDIMTDLEKRS
ncbi:MAG: hypothetical protein AB7K24_04220 [Gemmataceae bacterium]